MLEQQPNSLHLRPETAPFNDMEAFRIASLQHLTRELALGLPVNYPRFSDRYRAQPDFFVSGYPIPRGPWDTSLVIPTVKEYEAIRETSMARDAIGRPLHPWLAAMLQPEYGGVATGKGDYYHFGPNFTADPIVVKSGHVLLIQRLNGTFALPGGFVDAGESPGMAGTREAWEETGFDVSNVTPLQIYQGPVADIRMTAHAWPETTALFYDLGDGPLPEIEATSPEVLWAGWIPLEEAQSMPLYGSHNMLLDLVPAIYLET